MELGLYTFADVSLAPGPDAIGPHQRLRNLIEEIELADQVGLDVFGLGEHHRPDYAASAPVVALAAAAERTRRIKLTSAVSVLSSDDPVRVFQQFSTLDLLSCGRAEIMAGRGSFIESFPLFGYDLDDYDELFAEKLELLLKLNEGERISWPGGRHTPKIDDSRRLSAPIPGQAADLDRRRRNAAVGGARRRARPAAGARHHRRRAGALRAAVRSLPAKRPRRAGHDPETLATSLNVHGFVAETTEQGRRRFLRSAGRGHEPHRPRARLGADEPGAFRSVARSARRAFRGRSGSGRRKDRRAAQDFSATTASCCRWRSG